MTNENNLVAQEEVTGNTLTSLEVAEMVGRNHADVMRDIRNIIPHLGVSNFAESSFFVQTTYTNTQNREQPMFLLTKKGCELYATRMTGPKGVKFAVGYIERFNEMEKALKKVTLPVPALPTTYEEALESLLETVREKNRIKEKSDKIREDSVKVLEYTESVKPAVALGSQYLDAMSDLTLSEFATLMQGTKVIPYGRNTFYKHLRNHGYITTATPLRATQRAISGELMYNVTGTLERNGSTINTVTVMVTSKGVESLIRTFMGKEGVKQLKALGQYEELVAKFKKYEEG